MKIKPEIVDQINNVPSRRVISTRLDISDAALYQLLRANSDNGRLTKMDALRAISAEVGIDNVDELLCEEQAA